MKTRFSFGWILLMVILLFLLASCNLPISNTPQNPTSPPSEAPPVALTTEAPKQAVTEAPAVVTPVPPSNTDGADTVFVPGGVFVLGSNPYDTGALPHEMPEFKVELSGFNIYTHEVTNGMYQACVDAGACLPVTAVRSDLIDYITNTAFIEFPVIGVDWYMAEAYCKWANGRLPTEAEWEAAARGTDDRIYPWGNNPAGCDNTMMLGCGKENIPYLVGGFAYGNSPYQGWDMAGNVWEWVNDWYDANAYAKILSSNPYGPWQSDYKVIRGGGWNSAAQAVRSANRMGIEPSLSYRDLGFRCIANGFPTDPVISVTGETHSGSSGGSTPGGGTSVEDTPRAGGPGRDTPRTGTTPEEPTRTWSWGRLNVDCGSGGRSLFSIRAVNNFGGTYSVTVDGVLATCTYDAASGWLSCSFPSAPAGTTDGGPAFYRFIFTLSDPTGTPVPGATYTIGADSGLYSTCGSTETPSGARASAFCGPDNQPYIRITPATPTNFTEVLVGISDFTLTFSPSTCTSSTTEITCPAFSSSRTLAGTTAAGYTNGTALDGVTPLHATFDGISVPTCEAATGSETPRISAETSCSTSGGAIFRINTIPAGSLILTSILDAYGSPVSCAEGGGLYICSAPPAGSDGLVRINVRGNLPGTPGVDYPLPQLVFSPPDCPATPRSGETVTFGSLTCRPDGVAGVIASVSYTGSSSLVLVNSRYAGMTSACWPVSSEPNRFLCYIPIPLPSDLEFCISTDGSPFNCISNPYPGASLPTRCGGSDPSPVWTYAAGCRSRGTSGLDFEVSITGGLNVTSLTANTVSGSVPCNPNPSLSNSFNCPFSLAILGTSPTFHAVFADGSSADHVFDDFNSLIPADCPGSDDPTTPGGSTCADNTSVNNWHNPATGEDVNNDGCVTPRDILSIISRLNSSGAGLLPLPRPAGAPFFDVNGDGSLSPIDVLMAINYINGHSGEPCTPACVAPPGGDWTLDAVCNAEIAGEGWIEMRAHFPGERTTVNAIGQSYRGCGFGGDPTNGSISQYCPTGTDFSFPMLFWTRRADGSISQRTFTNAADLAASCSATATAAPNFAGDAICSSFTTGTYDIKVTWDDPAYSIYAIYNSRGEVLTGCGICEEGACGCNSISPESDGLIHIQMDHRDSSGEVATPLIIVPPTNCNSNDGWRLTGECSTSPYASPNQVEIHITAPGSIRFTSSIMSLLKPGWISCWDEEHNTVSCAYDLYLTPRGPLTIHYALPGGELATHTFNEFDDVVPLSCLPATEENAANSINIRCVNGRAVLSLEEPSWSAISSVTFNGTAPGSTDCLGLGTRSITCMVPISMTGSRVDIHEYGVNASGSDIDYDWGESYIPSCRSTPTPSPTPTAKPHSARSCSSYSDPSSCSSHGCSWDKIKSVCH